MHVTAPNAETYPSELAAELRVALMRSVRRVRQERSTDALTDGQYSVLARLDCAGPQTPGALADFEHVQPPSMTRTIAGLADAGLLIRSPHPTDRRALMVDLTPAGREIVLATRRRRTAWLADQLAQLSAEDRDTLARAAHILTEMVGR